MCVRWWQGSRDAALDVLLSQGADTPGNPDAEAIPTTSSTAFSSSVALSFPPMAAAGRMPVSASQVLPPPRSPFGPNGGGVGVGGGPFHEQAMGGASMMMGGHAHPGLTNPSNTMMAPYPPPKPLR